MNSGGSSEVTVVWRSVHTQHMQQCVRAGPGLALGTSNYKPDTTQGAGKLTLHMTYDNENLAPRRVGARRSQAGLTVIVYF